MANYAELLALLAPSHQAAQSPSAYQRAPLSAHPYMGAYAVAPGASPPMAGQAPAQPLLGTLGGIVGPAAKPAPLASGRGWNDAYSAHGAGSLGDTGTGAVRGSRSQHPGYSSAPPADTSGQWYASSRAGGASQAGSPKPLKTPIQGLGPFKPVA
jgi:hypothetical protein